MCVLLAESLEAAKIRKMTSSRSNNKHGRALHRVEPRGAAVDVLHGGDCDEISSPVLLHHS